MGLVIINVIYLGHSALLAVVVSMFSLLSYLITAVSCKFFDNCETSASLLYTYLLVCYRPTYSNPEKLPSASVAKLIIRALTFQPLESYFNLHHTPWAEPATLTSVLTELLGEVMIQTALNHSLRSHVVLVGA